MLLRLLLALVLALPLFGQLITQPGGTGSGAGVVSAGTEHCLAFYPAAATTVDDIHDGSYCRLSYNDTTHVLTQYDASGNIVAQLSAAGFWTQGMQTTTGHALELGNAGDSDHSSLIIRGGDGATNSEPGYIEAYQSGTGEKAFLFPCDADGHWCVSATEPGAQSTDFVSVLSDFNTEAKLEAIVGIGLTSSTERANLEYGQMSFTLNGGGSAIATGVQASTRAPADATITGYELSVEGNGAACSIAVDIWTDAVSTDLETDVTNADSICDGGTCPSLSSAKWSATDTLTSWTTDVVADERYVLQVDSADCTGTVQLILKTTRD